MPESCGCFWSRSRGRMAFCPLHAAALDLLAAAKLFLDKGICPANWSILRAAVEKAEGKEPTDAR